MKTNSIISCKEQLIDWFKEGEKNKEEWRVGTEHEKFAYNYSKSENRYYPLEYSNKNGVEEFLNEIAQSGWKKIEEQGKTISLKKENQSITLEPGGQIELSGAPLKDIHSACKETNEHLKLLKKIGDKLNITLLGMGLRPFEKTTSIPWMPKSRYKIMKNYMPKKGKLGLDMMLSTCTVQANLDYSSESDMVAKTLLASKIQPIITAIFANSPLSDGKPNGFLSKRRYIWANTDDDRCGTLKVAFDDNFSYSKYIDFALSVPMYFVRRNNTYIDCSGESFIDFMNSNLKQLEGEKPIIQDWEDHLSTIFTEVRLKKFIEVRGADAGNWQITCALPAFWVVILYNEKIIYKALKLCEEWSFKDVETLSIDAAKYGLNAKVKKHDVYDIAFELIKFAKEGLNNRYIIDKNGNSEAQFLKVLEEIVINRKTPAEQLLENYRESWDQNINKLIEAMSY